MIIDFHTHTFPDKIAAKTVHHLSTVSHSRPWTDGSISALSSSMKKAGIDYSINLPVATNVGQVEKLNQTMIRNQEDMLKSGVITLGCMHPAYENYRDQLKILKDNGIKGIKLHPAYQEVDLDDINMMHVIDAASELDMIVLIHAGIDIGIFDHDYSSVKHILKVIDQIHPPKFVLAHMGGWACWDDVERDLAGAPVWLDTGFAIGPIERAEGDPTPPYIPSNLSHEDFVRLCRKHGTDRILFATDSPWADQKDYVDRVKSMPFTDIEMEHIFSGNALELLGMR
ncbi:MAG: amidohydrolase family protein [Eubacterium sp.]|nr:amidohydrolase family protein [Eubacterium sp.]